MERASTLGLTVHATRVSLLMESGKVKAAGSQPRTMETSISVHMRPIRKTDMEGMCGLMAASMKEALPTMSSNYFFMQGWERTLDLSGWKGGQGKLGGGQSGPD